MLVLTRGRDEEILIGDDIKVTVVEIGQGRVRLGIVAPGLKILREELKRRLTIKSRLSPPIAQGGRV